MHSVVKHFPYNWMVFSDHLVQEYLCQNECVVGHNDTFTKVVGIRRNRSSGVVKFPAITNLACCCSLSG